MTLHSARRLLTFTVLFILSCHTGFGQNISFTAQTEAREVLAGSPFQVNFQLENARGGNFEAPDFGGLTVLSGPNLSQSTSISNGQVSSSVGYSYVLTATKPGKYRIGRASVKVNGRQMRTDELIITALKNTQQQQANTSGISSGDVMIKAKLSTEQAFTGQLVYLTYTVYARVGLEGVQITEVPELQGCYTVDIKSLSGLSHRTVINGKEYNAQDFRKVAIYPGEPGTINIAPLRLAANVRTQDPSNDPFTSFFGGSTRRIGLSSNPLTLKVYALPQGAPASFNGAIGVYKVDMDLARDHITTDEALSLTLRIDGSGDVKRLLPPDIAFPDGFDKYDPKVTDERTVETNEALRSLKTFEYVATPDKEGVYELRPEFSWFDPIEKKYKTAAPPMTLTVTKGSGKSAGEDSKPLTRNPDASSQKFNLFSGKWLALIAGLALIAFAVYYIRKNKNPIPAAAFQETKAPSEALPDNQSSTQASQARQIPSAPPTVDETKPGEILQYIRYLLLEGVGARFGLDKAQSTPDNILSRLKSSDLNAGMIEEWNKWIQYVNKSLYAGMPPIDNLRDVREKVEQLIKKIK